MDTEKDILDNIKRLLADSPHAEVSQLLEEDPELRLKYFSLDRRDLLDVLTVYKANNDEMGLEVRFLGSLMDRLSYAANDLVTIHALDWHGYSCIVYTDVLYQSFFGILL